jgi:hypothetical protein
MYPYRPYSARPKLRWPFYLAAIIVLYAFVTVGTIVYLNDGLHTMFQDPGVAMCNELKTDVEQHVSGHDDYIEIRAKFTRSQYADLRVAGPAFIDAMTPFIGTTPDQQTGAALLMGGTILDRWGSLVGACGAHGVQLPHLP